MPRVLIVNSNSSASATEQIEAGCRARLSPGTDVTYMTAEAGPEGIDTPLDVAISGLETARTILRHEAEYDAFVVACGNDPGLDIARQVTDKPVVGIGEAGMLFALTLGAKFSVVTLLRAETPLVEETVRGMAGALDDGDMDLLRDRSADLLLLSKPHRNGAGVAVPARLRTEVSALLARIERRTNAFTD